MSDRVRRRLGWVLLFCCAAIMAWLFWQDMIAPWMYDRERINIQLGLWASRFLVATLAISPLSALTREPGLKRLRRWFGLAAFAFIVVHAIHYIVYVRLWPAHMRILIERPYLVFGEVALAFLIPLALTSTDAAVRWIGPKRWRTIHRLIYPAAVLSLVHAILGYADLYGEMGVQTVLIALLLGWRVVRAVRRARPRRRRPVKQPEGSAGLASEPDRQRA